MSDQTGHPVPASKMPYIVGAVLALVAVVAAVLLASGGGDEDNEAFCRNVEDFEELLTTAGAFEPESMEDLEGAIAELDRFEADLKSTAPSSIRSDMETLFSIDSDTNRVSEQEALAEAKTKVNDYIRDECDLAIEL